MAQTEIKNRFSPTQPLEADVITELESIMRIHELSVDDLFLKWDSYCFRMEMDVLTSLTIDSVRNLKQVLLDDLEKSQRETHIKAERKMASGTPRAKPGAVSRGNSDVFGMIDGLIPSTPGSGGKLSRAGGSTLKKSHAARNGPASSPASNMSSQLKGVDNLAYVSCLYSWFLKLIVV